MSASSPSSAARTVAALALGLLLFVLVVELGGAVYFFAQHKRLVYAGAPASAPPRRVEDAEYKQRLHPYFGFTGPYSASFRLYDRTVYTNSLGFFQREPLALPVARAGNDFIVALFGGSVAGNLVHTPRGGLALEAALRKLPALSGRRIVLINMAQGSSKEPQPLLELAYLLALGQSVDLVVAVDGFNELALGLESWQNGLDPILPAGLIIGALAQEVMPATAASADYYEIAYRVSAAKRDIERREAAAQATRTGTGYLVDRARVALDRMTLKTYLEQYNKAINTANDSAARLRMLGLDLPVDVGRPDKVRELFDLWMRSSRQLRLLAEANRIGVLHIVQPNQYYSKKTFTDTEKRVALSLPPGHAYRVAVAEGYRMLEALPRGDAISAIPLYDAETGDIYVDNCCHVNARGETMLAEFVAARVAEWLERRERRAGTPGAQRQGGASDRESAQPADHTAHRSN